MTPKRQRTRPESSHLREDPPNYGNHHPLNADRDPDINLDPAERRMVEFLRYLQVVELEPRSTLARQLISDEIELPAPESLTEKTVGTKLTEVIAGLAGRRHFLSNTNHLSDLELYRHLWELTLNQPSHELDDSMGECAGYLDLVGDGSEESIWIWLRYYATEPQRNNWAHDFPWERVPEAAAPPFDRDRHLPKPYLPEV